MPLARSTKGFGGSSSTVPDSGASATSTSSSTVAVEATDTGVSDSDRKWRLEAYDKDEWRVGRRFLCSVGMLAVNSCRWVAQIWGKAFSNWGALIGSEGGSGGL